jgi:hypothetical protein
MVRRPRFFVLAAILVALFFAPSARAAAVVLELRTFGPGAPEPLDTWMLMASTTSSADNDGLSGYNIDLVNINSADNLPPIILSGGTPVQGFIVGGDDLVGDGAIFAGQNSTISSSILYHVGEPGFPGPDPSPLVGQNVPWGEPPILLATGTGPWDLVNFGSSTNANVFVEGQAALGGTDADPAEVVVLVNRIVPEPTTALLLVFGLIGLAAGRCRSAL